MKKIVMKVIVVVIALPLVYGAKHIAHKKCVEAALEMQCKKIAGFVNVVSVDVPWWTMISDGYSCTAQLKMNSKEGQDRVVDVSFKAKRVGTVDAAADVVKAAHGQDVADDWEVNMGFWGWLGDDYRIQELKAAN